MNTCTFAKRYGPWALITGATTEISTEFAIQLAELGINLVLIARGRDCSDELAHQLACAHGIQVMNIKADLSQPDFMSMLEPATRNIDIGLLINNAGFAMTGSFLAQDLEPEVAQLHLDCRAPLILTHVYGNRLAQRGKGGIIFVSSMGDRIARPCETNYAANRVYERFLAEALRFELAAVGIDVLALCPGEADTEFQVVSGNQIVGALPVRPLVELALGQLDRRELAMLGGHRRMLAGLLKCAPRRLQAMVADMVTGRLKSL